MHQAIEKVRSVREYFNFLCKQDMQKLDGILAIFFILWHTMHYPHLCYIVHGSGIVGKTAFAIIDYITNAYHI